MKTKYHSQAKWLEIGSTRRYYRSKFEANFARHLEWLKQNHNIKEWVHEPMEFLLKGRKGTVSLYKPDFLVTECDGSQKLYEVKGYMDDRSRAKINAFIKQYPQHNLTVIDKKWFAENAPKLKKLVPEWS